MVGVFSVQNLDGDIIYYIDWVKKNTAFTFSTLIRRFDEYEDAVYYMSLMYPDQDIIYTEDIYE